MAIPNFPELEFTILKDWKERKIFEQTLAREAPKGRFVFFEGPPTANGIPHIGHVETRVFKDIMLRFKTMQGYRVERKAGWDTQGLPVELEVEKQLGISGKKGIEEYGVAKFNAEAKASVWKYKAMWEQMTERIGFWLDTDHPYITYSNDYIETLWWILQQAWEQKLLVQDYKVVPYCPRCGTALSSHEVAQGYQVVKDRAVYVKFELVDEPGTFLIAWTTTPWTLPGNVALAVGKKIVYVRTGPNEKGERFILAKDRVLDVLGPDTDIGSAKTISGKELVGKSYKPLFDFLDLAKESGKKAYTVLDADFVTTAEGSGIVHTAVMYGVDDFTLGKQHDLPMVHTVDLEGKFTAIVKPWAGLEVRDKAGATQEKIVQYLNERHLVLKEESYEHDYPFCWRCKHPLLYYAKTSWFILMSKLRDQLLKNNATINWHPAHIQDGRFGEWLREVKDWAISRERYWGTPLPIWECPSCHKQECFGSYAEVAERVPSRNKYILVRHGQSLNNAKKVLNTVRDHKNDVPLSDEGREQTIRDGEQLMKLGIDTIYSSEFRRAVETAEIFGKRLNLPVTTDERINEYLIGPEFEGKSPEEFHQAIPHRADRLTQAPPGGETWTQMQQRFFSFFLDLEQRHEGKTFLIVSHADPILEALWAVSFKPTSALSKLDDHEYASSAEFEYPVNGKLYELHFPAAMFSADGLFDPHRPNIDQVTIPCRSCPGTMQRVLEVADAWFDSGAMPFAQWHYPFEHQERIDQGESFPADYISEAIDQTRGWFYTLLAIGTILQQSKVVKAAPYKNVIVLGHLNDAKGRKLSKSLKNYGSLDEIFSKHGADAVRWFLVTVNQPWDTKNFDPAGLDEVVKKTFLILMNVVSFWKIYATADSDVVSDHVLDRWIMSRLSELRDGVTDRLEQYDLTGAARLLASFTTELSTWYVRRSRDRFKGAEAAGAVSTLRTVLLTLSRLFAPFTPFLSEMMYRDVGGKAASVHLEPWPEAQERNETLLKDMTLVRTIVEQGHALRAMAGIKVRQPLGQLVIKPEIRPDLDEIVCDELNVKSVTTGHELPAGAEWATTDILALDVTITDELKEEGMVRDIIREINALRKTAKLRPTDQIILCYEPKTMIASLLQRYESAIRAGVRAELISPGLDAAEHATDLMLGGQTYRLGLRLAAAR